MKKDELLKSIGFSESYISHLKKMDGIENYEFESLVDDLKPLSKDLSNITVDQSINKFTTLFVLHPKNSNK